jgi:hypothetical protein
LPATPEYSAQSVLDELFRLSDPAQSVVATAERNRLRIDADQLRFRVTSATAGHVYVLMSGTKGTDLFLLFPNDKDRNNRIAANGELALPRSGWPLVFEGPPGINRFLVIVSARPRDFGAAGVKPAGIFREFEHKRAARLLATLGAQAFAGTAEGCNRGDARCAAFGAATFDVEEYR